MVVAFSLLAAYGSIGSPYRLHIVILTLFAVTLAVSYRLLLLTGEASFCHGAFYALGAYAVGILTTKADLGVWASLPVAVLTGGVAAVVIGVPSLRTQGSYFFLMTFGFMVITSALLQNATTLTGGFSGLNGIPTPAGVQGVQSFYYLALAAAAITLAVFWAIDLSRWGLRLRALGDSRELAQAAGVNRFGSMLLAFSIGGMFAGGIGGVYASYITFISPNSFTMWVSVYVLAYAVVGGSRHLLGPVVGAVLLSFFPVLFNWSQTLVGIFASAAMLLVIMIARDGLVGLLITGVRWLRSTARRKHRDQPVKTLVEADTTRDIAPDMRAHLTIAASPSLRTESTPEELLVVSNLSIRFGGVAALSDVSLTVHEGETVGLIGPNGAGKTTFFNVISGFAKPDSGRVALRGEDLVGEGAHRVARRGLTRSFQSASVFERLTVEDNLLVALRGERSDGDDQRQAAEILQMLGLADHAGQLAGDLPYGLKKILGVGIGLAARPRVLCLDEPVAGLTGHEIDRMVDVLRTLQQSGQAILLVEHRMPLVVAVCQRLYVLDFGRIIASGQPDQILADPAVRDAYLGEEYSEGAHA